MNIIIYICIPVHKKYFNTCVYIMLRLYNDMYFLVVFSRKIFVNLIQKRQPFISDNQMVWASISSYPWPGAKKPSPLGGEALNIKWAISGGWTPFTRKNNNIFYPNFFSRIIFIFSNKNRVFFSESSETNAKHKSTNLVQKQKQNSPILRTIFFQKLSNYFSQHFFYSFLRIFWSVCRSEFHRNRSKHFFFVETLLSKVL